jgi:tetratricopeptide (TPR) repeat protein
MAVGLRLEQDAGQELDAGPAILSNHFSLAGDYARAQGYAMAAAKLATERFSHADAVRLYRRAIEAGRAGGVEANIRSLAEAWEQLGDALRQVGEPAAAVRALSEARKLVGEDPIAQARLFRLHAEVAERSSALTAAVRWLRRGFRSLDEVQGDEAIKWRARMWSKLAGVRAMQGRWEDAISDCRVAMAQAESVGELSALAHACHVLDWALVESGRPAEATYSWRALEIYEQLGDPAHEAITLNNLGMFAYWEGRWDDAIDLYRKAGECGERAGRPADAAYPDCNVGEILSDQGHLDEAQTQLQRALRVWSGTGEQQAVAYVSALLARLAVRRGEYREGLSMLEGARSELRRLGIDAYAELAQAWIAEAEAFGGDPVRALELARQALQASDRQRPLLRRVAGIAQARLGQQAVALRELRQSLETARSRNGEYDIAATIDMIDHIGGADPDLLLERDRILERLRIQRLPVPDLAPVN